MERECPSCDHRKISSSTKQLTAIGKCLVSFTCLRCKYIWDEVHESAAKSAAESAAKSAAKSAAESAAKSAAKSPLHNSTPRLVHTPDLETLEEKQRVLTQFETVMFHYSTAEAQLSEFREMFKNGILNLPNPIYRAWVVLKLAAVGSPQESFDFVLEKRIPKNLPRPKPKIKRIQPDGEQLYYTQSEEWMEILQNREAAKAVKNNNNNHNNSTATATKSKPKAVAGAGPGSRKTKKKPAFSSIPCLTCLSTSHKCIICQEKCCALCKAGGELNGHICHDCFSTTSSHVLNARYRIILALYKLDIIIIILAATSIPSPSTKPRVR